MITKKISVVLLASLLIWFTLDITGLYLGDFRLVSSALTSEPIDVLWWLIFLALFIVFMLKEKIGQYLMLGFLSVWACLQGSNYFLATDSGIQKYNDFFAREGTFYLFSPSSDYLVKDLYHLILDTLILLSLVAVAVFVIEKRRKTHTARRN